MLEYTEKRGKRKENRGELGKKRVLERNHEGAADEPRLTAAAPSM